MAGRGTDIVLGKVTIREAFKHWQAQGLIPKRLKPDSPELDEAAVDLWTTRYLGEAEAAKLKAQPLAAKLQAINAKRRLDGYPALNLPSSFSDSVDVRSLGGLRIVGTERHDSRRIDNQLRGRSGRQGDAGSTRFYLSLDDDLMKRFAGPMLSGMMRKMGLKDGIPIESGMVSRAVEKAQKRVEEYHYGARKNLLEYDQVANQQRTIIYTLRQRVLTGKDLDAYLLELFRGYLDDLIQTCAEDGTRGAELARRIAEEFSKTIGLPAPEIDELPVKNGGEACLTVLMQRVEAAINARRAEQSEAFPFVLRFILLDSIDRRWKDHLYQMDHLRHAIGLESYAQKDPRLRFKEEGYRLFTTMHGVIKSEVARIFFRVQVQAAPPVPENSSPAAALSAGGFAQRGALAALSEPVVQPNRPAPGDPCPCGSGLLFKRCHGK